MRHPLIAWMIKHAGNLINWCKKGHDGRTAYHRVRSRPFHTRLMNFGEACSFKNRSHEPVSAADGRRWHSGTFLGMDRRTGQYTLYDGKEIKLARTVMRLPDGNKWDKEALSAVNSTPWDLHRPRELEVVFKDKVVKDAELVDKVALSRQVYIKAQDLIDFGLTRGCPRCDHQLQYGAGRTGKPHSQRCRERLMGELAKTDAGKRRISAASDRLDRTVADLGQQHRDDLPQGEIVQSMGQDQPVMEAPNFIPLPENIDEPLNMRDESREVPPPADEPGVGETHDLDGREQQAGPSMDIDMITEDVDLKELMSVLTRDARKEIKELNAEILEVVQALGGSSGQYKRERQKGIRAVVSEIYSPPRVTAATKLLPELKIIPGFALDLTTADADGKLWDFDSKIMRDRAMQKVKDERPMLLVGSPMCTAFSTWQRINDKIRDPVVVAGEKKRAIQHLEFCVELYKEQMRHGRYFIHEHPAYATSWQEASIENLLKERGVERATCDQCQYGSTAENGDPVKKPTTFMTNAPELAGELRARCQGRGGACSRRQGGQHAQCRGKTARMAAVYHFKLCRAILVGFRKQLQKDGNCQDGFIGILEAGLGRGERETELYELRGNDGEIMNVHIENSAIFKDDLTGQLLDPELVRAARAKELEYFEGKKVWELRTINECRRLTGKPPVTVRWVDVNKGDDVNPNVRSRLVARQIRQAG